jgi:deoxyribose-phosphate aldolase
VLTPATLAGLIDHTLLTPEAGRSQLEVLCAEARTHHTASVCVNSARVAEVRELLDGAELAICSVIGFPFGVCATAAKVSEATAAMEAGATEFDMVIDLGALRDGNDEIVQRDIEAVREATRGLVLKVIVESAALTAVELRRACELSVAAGADYVKTSTGFHPTGGATVEAVALMRAAVGRHIRVKASGGIRDLATVEAMLDAGADRIGMSRTVSVLEELRAATAR